MAEVYEQIDMHVAANFELDSDARNHVAASATVDNTSQCLAYHATAHVHWSSDESIAVPMRASLICNVVGFEQILAVAIRNC